MVQVRQLGGCLCRHGRRVEGNLDAPVSIIHRNRHFGGWIELNAGAESILWVFLPPARTPSGGSTFALWLSSCHVHVDMVATYGRTTLQKMRQAESSTVHE